MSKPFGMMNKSKAIQGRVNNSNGSNFQKKNSFQNNKRGGVRQNQQRTNVGSQFNNRFLDR